MVGSSVAASVSNLILIVLTRIIIRDISRYIKFEKKSKPIRRRYWSPTNLFVELLSHMIMKVLIRQFLGKNHSWSCFGWGICQGLLDQGHKVDLFSTDGITNLPENLKQYLVGYIQENKPETLVGKFPNEQYDCQISYTAMKNFPVYLGNGTKNRLGVWCYEWAGKNVLPIGFARAFKSCDYICPPSNFAKQVFMDSGIPENIIKVIPHGIISDNFRKTTKIDFGTNKKFKILSNIAQNHLRKNIPGLLDAYGKAFTRKDDVCLILKAKDKPAVAPFEISLNDCLKDFYRKYPNHAEIKVYSKFVDDISDLYRSADAMFTMTHSECFLLPSLEIIAAGKMAIAPNWGGQIDFLNSENSLLINGSEVRADPRSMYWESKNNAVWFKPDISDAVDKLRFAYANYEEINKKVELNKENILTQYDWGNIANQFLNLCK